MKGGPWAPIYGGPWGPHMGGPGAPKKRAKYYCLAVFYNFLIFRKICCKTDFLKELTILMGTENQRKKSSPFMGSNQFFIFFLILFEKSIYLMVFKLWDRFWTLPDGLLDPLDRYKNQKKNLKKSMFSFFLWIFTSIQWVQRAIWEGPEQIQELKNEQIYRFFQNQKNHLKP